MDDYMEDYYDDYMEDYYDDYMEDYYDDYRDDYRYIEEPINSFSWSLARDTQFNDCKRSYYYQYYEYFHSWLYERNSRKYRINVLRNLTTKEMWIGKIVHEMIPVIIWNFRQFGRFDFSRADEILTRKMHNDWCNSRDRYIYYDAKAYVGLAEHFYGLPITDEDFEDALQKVRASIQAFYALPDIDRFLDHKTSGSSEIEKNSQFSHNDILVTARLDYLSVTKDGALIIDWKTGKMNQLARSIDRQLGIYALYVKQKYNLSSDQIQAWDINLLNSGARNQHQISPETIAETSYYITESARKMKDMLIDPEENKADIRDFPMQTDRKCSFCNYRAACFPRRYPFPEMPA